MGLRRTSAGVIINARPSRADDLRRAGISQQLHEHTRANNGYALERLSHIGLPFDPFGVCRSTIYYLVVYVGQRTPKFVYIGLKVCYLYK